MTYEQVQQYADQLSAIENALVELLETKPSTEEERKTYYYMRMAKVNAIESRRYLLSLVKYNHVTPQNK